MSPPCRREDYSRAYSHSSGFRAPLLDPTHDRLGLADAVGRRAISRLSRGSLQGDTDTQQVAS